MQPVGFRINPTFSFTLLGTFAIYLWTRPRLSEWLWVLPIAAAMRVAFAATMGGFGGYFAVAWISWGTFLGLATLVVLAVQALRTSAERRRTYTRTFYAGSIFPLLAMVTGYFIPLNLWLRPTVFDPFLFRLDGALGFQPSFVLGRLLATRPVAWGWTTVIYYALPLSGGILYASHRLQHRQQVQILPLLISFILVGFALYSIFPAVGPAHVFPNLYPWTTPSATDVALEPIANTSDPRNCMPSLHFGAALLVWWNSRSWPGWGRTLAASFLIATAFSTLALGEHYVADLVVAFPFTLAFQAAWTTSLPRRSKQRYIPLLIGVVLWGVWLVLARYAVPIFEKSLLGTWLAMLVTISVSSLLKARLAGSAKKTLAEGI